MLQLLYPNKKLFTVFKHGLLISCLSFASTSYATDERDRDIPSTPYSYVETTASFNNLITIENNIQDEPKEPDFLGTASRSRKRQLEDASLPFPKRRNTQGNTSIVNSSKQNKQDHPTLSQLPDNIKKYIIPQFMDEKSLSNLALTNKKRAHTPKSVKH